MRCEYCDQPLTTDPPHFSACPAQPFYLAEPLTVPAGAVLRYRAGVASFTMSDGGRETLVTIPATRYAVPSDAYHLIEPCDLAAGYWRPVLRDRAVLRFAVIATMDD